MRSKVTKLYAVSLILMVVLIICVGVTGKVNKVVQRENTECTCWDNYEYQVIEDESAPQGVVEEYIGTLENIPKNGGCLEFYLVHQEVEVYIEDELIYSLSAPTNTFAGHTTGSGVGMVLLNCSDEGKEIRICVKPIYKSSVNNTLTFNFGSYYSIYAKILKNDMFGIIIAGIAILIGIVFIGFVLVNFKSNEVDKSLIMLGLFAIQTGMWKLTDMASASLICSNISVLSAISLVTLSAMPISYIFYIKNHFVRQDYKIWGVTTTIMTISSILIMLMHLFGIKDMRETLWMTHSMFGIAIVAIVSMSVYEYRHTVWSKKLKVTIFCILLCLCGTVSDTIAYYLTGNSKDMVFALMAFLVYIVIMGCISIKETRDLIAIAKQTKYYEKLAFHDQLTGLYNRTYYMKYISDEKFNYKDCMAIMLDVNELKKCNDTYGHDKGDHLIITSAKLIAEVFGAVGKCCRMGGDEFCVLIEKGSAEECERLITVFQKKVYTYNQEHTQEFRVNIACGYAGYEEEVDQEFDDILRRADKMMYKNKAEIKK